MTCVVGSLGVNHRRNRSLTSPSMAPLDPLDPSDRQLIRAAAEHMLVRRDGVEPAPQAVEHATDRWAELIHDGLFTMGVTDAVRTEPWLVVQFSDDPDPVIVPVDELPMPPGWRGINAQR